MTRSTSRYRLLVTGAILAASLVGASLVPGQGWGATGLAGLRLAQEHLSAIIVVQRWAEFAYDLRPRIMGGCTPTFSDPVEHPDGSFTQSFVNEDCSRGTITSKPDLSFRTVIRYPDGFGETVTGVTSDFTRPPDIGPQQYDVQHVLSTGDRATYRERLQLVEFFPNVFFITRIDTTGTLTLASGRRATFTFAQGVDLPRDLFDVRLPGGERLHWEIPVDFDGLPDLSRPAPGTYRVGSQKLDFAVVGEGLAGEGGRFTRWTLRDNRGLDGLFNLNADFSGRGRALRRGRLQFVGSWNRKAVGTVLLANGQAAVAGPSAGAQDFGNTRFRGLALANAPHPGL